MQEDVPEGVRGGILPCVWPSALSSDTQEEADLWFEKRLKLYLPFLTKDLISSTETQSAKCLPFSKFVSVLGNNYNYGNSDFEREDVYDTIKTYLNTGTKPRCYSASDPQLTSTAWFVNYIGVFVTFISLADLNALVPTDRINIFLEDPKNIKLFNNPAIPKNVISFYTSQLYTQNPSFSPFLIPGLLLCEVPSSAYISLNQSGSMHILELLNQFCNDSIDPEASAALVENFKTFDESSIQSLGQQSTGLTTGQITTVPPSVLVSSLETLSSVSGWNQGQSSAVIQQLAVGGFEINDASALVSLGSLIGGVPSEKLKDIPSSELIVTAQNPAFVANMIQAPKIVQLTYVSKIITVNQDPNVVLQNVPDEMATEIPRSLLDFSQASVDIEKIVAKTWDQDQAAVFFEKVASGTNDAEILSPSVLQGFTCNGVRAVKPQKIKGLIRACRPRKDRKKVVLKESQLTCMYNLIKDEEPQAFTDYPSDMLLYYSYEKVEKVKCKSYFSAAGEADFTVLSTVLKKEVSLLNNAKDCLGIEGTSISSGNVEVLGNMCCTLDGSYIENSDATILEKLKNCKDLSDEQITSVEKVLLAGTTQYGDVSTWNQQTLEDLGILPLYLTKDFWNKFDKSVKKKFLKTFMPQLRGKKTAKRKLRRLFKQINSERAKRAAGCTVGDITHSTIVDGAFPFGYDASQFDLCLDVNIVKDNLAALTEKVDDEDFQKIILVKLNQAYPAGIPDEQVQVLGSVSRAASIDDINKWSITKIDTLAALMVADDGEWEPDKSEAIITKYLSTAGNSLRTAELNSVGGSNLCSLEAGVLKGITPDSLSGAKALDISACSLDQKKELYKLARTAFSAQRNDTGLFYQLISPYLGGAPIEDIRTLSTQNLGMDISIFKSLAQDVALNLTVNEVKGLLGTSLPDLKTFENDTLIQKWISEQLQSELTALNIGLTGGKGRVDPPPVTVPGNNGTSNGTVTVNSPTTGNGASYGIHLGSTSVSLSLILWLMITALRSLL
ncbi:hypothetical protein JZ751_026204 [Albula glossodonta]|uniref:Mesothelin-like protein n=1 Tax=Albula glossodonta TaxID=121402 RepID=A0A8T2PF85_9TELE|nr:hypothetical protein JZ751_026204 [Albula glossodonta]